MADNILVWVAPDDTDSDDTFDIWTDYGSTPGVYISLVTGRPSVDRGDGQYYAYQTTLNAAVTDLTSKLFVFAGAVNFANGDIVFVGQEGPILLGGKSGVNFTDCTRGPVPVTHVVGETIYKAHMSYTHSTVTWGSRHVIRYLVKAVVDTVTRTGARITKFNVPDPPDNSHCTVYGLLEAAVWKLATEINPNAPTTPDQVSITIEDGDNVLPATGANLTRQTITVTADDDGFWYVFLPRRRWQSGGDTYLLTIRSNAGGEGEGLERWRITNVPDADSVHFMAIAAAA